MGSLDRSLFGAINRWPDAIAPAMRFFSEGLDAGWIKGVLVAILVAMIAAGKDTRRAAILALIAFPLANLVTDLFKHGLPTPRPPNDPALESFILRIGATKSSGTASAHSANMMAVAAVFGLTLRGFGVPWLILALLVGLSRVYNGVHYPSQVLLGWTIGLLAATLVFFGARKIEAWRGNRRGAADSAP